MPSPSPIHFKQMGPLFERQNVINTKWIYSYWETSQAEVKRNGKTTFRALKSVRCIFSAWLLTVRWRRPFITVHFSLSTCNVYCFDMRQCRYGPGFFSIPWWIAETVLSFSVYLCDLSLWSLCRWGPTWGRTTDACRPTVGRCLRGYPARSLRPRWPAPPRAPKGPAALPAPGLRARPLRPRRAAASRVVRPCPFPCPSIVDLWLSVIRTWRLVETMKQWESRIWKIDWFGLMLMILRRSIFFPLSVYFVTIVEPRFAFQLCFSHPGGVEALE